MKVTPEVRKQKDGTYVVKVANFGVIRNVPNRSLAQRIRKIILQAWEEGMSNPYA